jgi:hypothetical protein
MKRFQNKNFINFKYYNCSFENTCLSPMMMLMGLHVTFNFTIVQIFHLFPGPYFMWGPEDLVRYR